VELRGRWWNGRWGRLARRDIWLKLDVTWRVEARKGDGDSGVWSHDYSSEEDARAAIAAMMDRTGGPGEWQDLTNVGRGKPDRDRSSGRPDTAKENRPRLETPDRKA
jgi:hypothetical protein